MLFRSYVLRDLVDCKADFAVVVDSSPTGASNRTVRDFAYCSRSDDRGLFGTQVLLERVVSGSDTKREASGPTSIHDSPQGRWIGMLNVSRQGLIKLKAT